MNSVSESENATEQIITKICKFFKIEKPLTSSCSVVDKIKEICVMRLCKAIGLASYNYKSAFFNFFSSIMGQAVCDTLLIKIQVASDDLRLIKHDHINLVNEVSSYLNTETVEEAFLDAFELADRFKYLIKDMKKV